MPPFSWVTMRELFASAGGRPVAWRAAGAWALHVLEERFGEGWPAAVISRSPDRSAGDLAWAAGHVIAFSNVLELALRLEVLCDVPGIAKVRRAIATDPRPGQLVHAAMQLEVAGLVAQAGGLAELEPRRGDERPADVTFVAGEQRLVVETRAIVTSDAWRSEQRQIDLLFERVRGVEASHGVRCEGGLSRLLDDEEAEQLLRRIEDCARLVAMGGEAPSVRVGGAEVRVVAAGGQPAAGMTGPRVGGDSWARIGARIAEKAEAARSSGATWLRLDARDGLWQFTAWARWPLERKLPEMAAVALPLLGGLDGLVLSSGSLLRHGAFEQEDVELPDASCALRRLIEPMRVREILIIPAGGGGAGAAQCWRELYGGEPEWLCWALDRVGLPSPEEIFAAH